MAETLKIKDLPIDDRPREAFMRSAEPDREISDAHLLAILIRSGRKGSSAIDLGIPLDDHVVIGRDGEHVSISQILDQD